MSGRLTPAAATSISTSPIAGVGIGRVTACRTSGPPGALISIAVMVVCIVIAARSWFRSIRRIAPLDRTRETGNRFATEDRMDEEDLAPRQGKPKPRDLTPLS